MSVLKYEIWILRKPEGTYILRKEMINLSNIRKMQFLKRKPHKSSTGPRSNGMVNWNMRE